MIEKIILPVPEDALGRVIGYHAIEIDKAQYERASPEAWQEHARGIFVGNSWKRLLVKILEYLEALSPASFPSVFTIQMGGYDYHFDFDTPNYGMPVIPLEQRWQYMYEWVTKQLQSAKEKSE